MPRNESDADLFCCDHLGAGLYRQRQRRPSLPNVCGPRHLGAYERQNLFRERGTIDSIFCDGFGP